VSRIGKFFKRVGRKTAKIHTKVNRVFVPIASAGAGFIGGAPAAAAVTALGAQSSYYFRATEARNQGLHGKAARDFGRKERKRVAIYGAIGGGAGMVGSFGYGLATGNSFLAALGQGAVGQGGAQLLNIGDSTIFSKAPAPGSQFVTAANLAAQKASPVPGLVTQAQLSQTLSSGSTAAEQTAAAAGKTGESSLLAKSLGLVTNVAEKMGPLGTPNGVRPTGPGSYKDGLLDGLLSGGGGGGGGGDMGAGGFMNAPMGEGKMSGSTIAILGIGALLLLS